MKLVLPTSIHVLPPPCLRQLCGARVVPDAVVLCPPRSQGMLLAGVGSKLVASVYKDDSLVALGFYISGFGVSALSTMNNYVLAGDIHTGLQLLAWKAERQASVHARARQ